MNAKSFPASLRTATPAEGHRLARELANRALAERAESRLDMAGHLSLPPPPSLEALTAAYFTAVAVVNLGWAQVSPAAAPAAN